MRLYSYLVEDGYLQVLMSKSFFYLCTPVVGSVNIHSVFSSGATTKHNACTKYVSLAEKDTRMSMVH